MTSAIPNDIHDHQVFEKRLGDLRPKVHRYCSRMVGSAIDGEDIVQEVLVKAIETWAEKQILDLESWLFRVAHNASVDFIRRRRRQDVLRSEEDPNMAIDDRVLADARVIASAGLKTFMYLPISHRGCVILMDVLGYSLREVAEITGLSIPAVKASLHRGRIRIREVGNVDARTPPAVLSQDDLRRLAKYVDCFNARDFDAVRDMLADDVRLELVSRVRMEGRQEVSRYFENLCRFWREVAPGLSSEDAAVEAGVSAPVGNRCFRSSGGMLPTHLSPWQRHRRYCLSYLQDLEKPLLESTISLARWRGRA
ncbi:RNA polymerase sigma-70 factor (ECF subfamily) [Rhizobium sp. BK313]|uniref:sigma-70 family RNA polymerase sigma factor n=1 Tax=Rhizobium sp. BK313 TaxID=2587081 RepID=UPI00105C475C|nr:RNA polymerase sigma-70 factor (ECF subfamily) [Rhizobium sp. BK313]